MPSTGKGSPGPEVLDESLRVAKLVEESCRAAGRSIRSIERELGYGSGTLSGQLSGRARLRFADLLAILRAIGEDVGEFFRAAYPESRAASPAEEDFPPAMVASGWSALPEGLEEELRALVRDEIGDVLELVRKLKPDR